MSKVVKVAAVQMKGEVAPTWALCPADCLRDRAQMTLKVRRLAQMKKSASSAP